MLCMDLTWLWFLPARHFHLSHRRLSLCSLERMELAKAKRTVFSSLSKLLFPLLSFSLFFSVWARTGNKRKSTGNPSLLAHQRQRHRRRRMDPHMSILHLPFFVCLPTVCLCLVCLLSTFPTLTWLHLSLLSTHLGNRPPVRFPLFCVCFLLPFICTLVHSPPTTHSSLDDQFSGEVTTTWCTSQPVWPRARLEGRTLGKVRLVVGAHSLGNGVTNDDFPQFVDSRCTFSTVALFHCSSDIKDRPLSLFFYFCIYLFIYLFVVFITFHYITFFISHFALC